MTKFEVLEVSKAQFMTQGIDGKEWMAEVLEADTIKEQVECMYENAGIILENVDDLVWEFTTESGEEMRVYAR